MDLLTCRGGCILLRLTSARRATVAYNGCKLSHANILKALLTGHQMGFGSCFWAWQGGLIRVQRYLGSRGIIC